METEATVGAVQRVGADFLEGGVLKSGSGEATGECAADAEDRGISAAGSRSHVGEAQAQAFLGDLAVRGGVTSPLDGLRR